MSAEDRSSGHLRTGHAALAEAWSRLPPLRQAASQLGRGFTASRMERILHLALSAGAVVLGAEAVFGAASLPDEGPLRTTIIAATFVLLGVLVVLGIAGRGARAACAAFALAFPVVLVVLGAIIPSPTLQPAPGVVLWPVLLLNVATTAAALAFPLPWQILWAVFVPCLFGAIRLARGRFGPEFVTVVAYDVSLAVIVAGVVVALVWMFRGLAAEVDEARAAAVAQYSRAVAAESAEQERIEMAALMHDSVLAALIAAGRAGSDRERRLAVSMAREALTRLANAESDLPEGSDAPVPVSWIADELVRESARLGVALHVPLDLRGRPDGPAPVPGRVARALVLAAAQAVANAVEHAAGAGLRAAVAADDAEVRVTVSDAGPGVDLDAIPADRLGIRGSIVARVAAVGGRADVSSGPAGTTVSLTWRTGEAR